MMQIKFKNKLMRHKDKFKKSLCLLFMLLAAADAAFGQTRQITGVVIEADGRLVLPFLPIR